jgi:hypothetical protein
LQGRYFLPAILGLLVPVLSHRVPAARYALLAGLVVVNLLLAQQTVTRLAEQTEAAGECRLLAEGGKPIEPRAVMNQNDRVTSALQVVDQ